MIILQLLFKNYSFIFYECTFLVASQIFLFCFGLQIVNFQHIFQNILVYFLLCEYHIRFHNLDFNILVGGVYVTMY